MSSNPIGRNEPCPCGSGKKYKQCCLKKSFDWVQDDEGTIRRSIPITEDFHDELLGQIDSVRDQLGREPSPDDPLFPGINFERTEHEIALAMQASGIDPAIIYAFTETGLLVSEENQHLLTDQQLDQWEDAIDRYRDSHPARDEHRDVYQQDTRSPVCWSCGKPVPKTAVHCPHCEAEVEELPSEELQAEAMQLLSQMDPSLIAMFQVIAEQSTSGEDFVNRVMIGPCPRCDSDSTMDCENDPEIDDPCIGRCGDCGLLFCSDCDELFGSPAEAVAHDCPFWQEMDEELEEFDDLDEPF